MSDEHHKEQKKDSSGKKHQSTLKKEKKLQDEIKHLQQELEVKNDKLLRNMADLQNLQRRQQRDLQHREEEIRTKYLLEILDLYELLKKAFEDENPKEGLKLLLQNVDNLLEKEQIKGIDCVGKPFDHSIHHAITTVEKEDCQENIIVDEIKKGYLAHDKLLRPSQVVVAKKKENTEENK